ncbi:DUF3137 domain-containing protein [Candidatus Saccharibacteria bacterium]|nr:DUF3137 domain-containing protein [Candidatus Saccharibacteria bacterium]
MDYQTVKSAHEAYRKKSTRVYTIGIIITVLLTLVGIGSGSFFFGFFLLFLAYGSTAVFAAVYTKNEHKAYRQAYKAYFVEKNLRKIFTINHYDHSAGLNRALLQSTNMVNTGDRYSSNDYTAGLYKDVGFIQADVHIEVEHEDSEGNSSYVTIFKGRWMVFEFPKKFNFRIEVIEKGFRAARIPGKNAKTGRKFERLKLESPEFNKLFKLYSEDGFETFYLMDPSFIHNITKLGQSYKGKLLLCFIDNKLHVGLHDNKDSFEPPKFHQKLDEATENAKVTEDIKLITTFIDELKLDRKIFQK